MQSKIGDEKWEDLTLTDKEEYAYNYLQTKYNEEVLDVVTNINGRNYETYCDLLYYYECERDFEDKYIDEYSEIYDKEMEV